MRSDGDVAVVHVERQDGEGAARERERQIRLGGVRLPADHPADHREPVGVRHRRDQRARGLERHAVALDDDVETAPAQLLAQRIQARLDRHEPAGPDAPAPTKRERSVHLIAAVGAGQRHHRRRNRHIADRAVDDQQRAFHFGSPWIAGDMQAAEQGAADRRGRAQRGERELQRHQIQPELGDRVHPGSRPAGQHPGEPRQREPKRTADLRATHQRLIRDDPHGSALIDHSGVQIHAHPPIGRAHPRDARGLRCRRSDRPTDVHLGGRPKHRHIRREQLRIHHRAPVGRAGRGERHRQGQRRAGVDGDDVPIGANRNRTDQRHQHGRIARPTHLALHRDLRAVGHPASMHKSVGQDPGNTETRHVGFQRRARRPQRPLQAPGGRHHPGERLPRDQGVHRSEVKAHERNIDVRVPVHPDAARSVHTPAAPTRRERRVHRDALLRKRERRRLHQRPVDVRHRRDARLLKLQRAGSERVVALRGHQLHIGRGTGLHGGCVRDRAADRGKSHTFGR